MQKIKKKIGKIYCMQQYGHIQSQTTEINQTYWGWLWWRWWGRGTKYVGEEDNDNSNIKNTLDLKMINKINMKM